MALEDINAGEEEGDRMMDKHVPWISGVMIGLTMWGCILNEISCYLDRGKMNEEIQEFRENYHPKSAYWEDLGNYG